MAALARRRRQVVRRFFDLLGGYTVFTCPDPGCDLAVRVRGMDAGEARAWQELAADHARHARLYPSRIR